MKHKNIFVACDTSNLNEIKKIIKQTQTNKLKVVPKFGLQFFYSKNGRKFLQNFKKNFWLDLKINDIPQTALSAVDSLKDLKKCKYVTVHVSGGLEMLKAITKKAKTINKNLKKARISRNPKTGEKVHTPEQKTIHFKMSKDLFKKLNDET